MQLSESKKNNLIVRIAETPEEIQAAQRLRYQVFAEELGVSLPNSKGDLDIDKFDEHCSHLLAFDNLTNEVIGCYRLLTESGAKAVGCWYSESEFDLSPLKKILPESVELGRACIHPDYRHGGLIMLLWAGLVKFIKDNNFRYLLGCGSIDTKDGGHKAVSLYNSLTKDYLAPEEWLVSPLNPLDLENIVPDTNAECPPLIKGYLNAGAWFCGKPCLDEAFNCADILILMDCNRLDLRYLQRLNSSKFTA